MEKKMEKRRIVSVLIRTVFLFCCTFPVSLLGTDLMADDRENQCIKPYVKDPRYWQYEAEPVLLVGGTKDDSPFQLPDMSDHLAELAGVGGNFVRNTMSDRQDEGFEVYAYEKTNDGKYDLDRWNEEYWTRFENFLLKTQELDIIVQIEVWDRFDYSQGQWEIHPYRPINNVNYTTENSGLRNLYPAPAWRDVQPFFHSNPRLPRYEKKLDVIREYQERFVAKMLSYSLDYDHVLYCMDNETSTHPAWGRHWIEFIEKAAKRKGVRVHCTDMFNDGYEPERSKSFAQAFDDPKVYEFLDLSQINSRIFGEVHWTKMRWVLDRIEKHPRPVNHVKIYGSGFTNFGSGAPEDGVERLWRNLMAGCAAVRFHRDGGGNGLKPIAKASIKAVRKVETRVKFWEVESHQELLSDREEDEAYLCAQPGSRYILYFTQGGGVGLDLREHDGKFLLKWVDIGSGEWGDETRIGGGRIVKIESPGNGPSVAVIVRS